MVVFIKGHGLVDEQRWRYGLTARPGDAVLAGSTVRCWRVAGQGMANSWITRRGRRPRTGYRAVRRMPAPGLRAMSMRGELAERTIMPTMAAAGLGLLVGGVSTAGAYFAT